MIETPNTTAQMVKGLENLGSPGAIAVFLRDQNIKGEQHCAHSCPISRFLDREVGGYHYTCADWTVKANGDSSETTIPFDRNLRAFVSEFDAGSYPYLIADE